MDVVPDFTVAGDVHARKHIDYIHRQTATEDIYFVSNSSQEEESVTCTFRVEAGRVPQLWDATTGRIQQDVAFTPTENGISVDLTMPPLSSRFVIFSKQTLTDGDLRQAESLQFTLSEEDISDKIDISRDWKISFDPEMGGP